MSRLPSSVALTLQVAERASEEMSIDVKTADEGCMRMACAHKPWQGYGFGTA